MENDCKDIAQSLKVCTSSCRFTSSSADTSLLTAYIVKLIDGDMKMNLKKEM